MKHLYRCAMYLILMVLVALLVSVLIFGPSFAIDMIVGAMGAADKLDVVLSLVAKISAWWFVAVLLFAIGLVGLGIAKQRVVVSYLQKFFYYWKMAFVNLFASLSAKEILSVLTIPFLASLYFAQTVAVSYDEAITYNFFTVKPFYYCMIFYPYPNNHVLHSLLTNITEYIPFVSALFSIRVPAILSSLLAWLIGYSFVKKYYSSRVAMLVVGLASVMYMSIFYSFMSRGYAFMVLAFVVCMYAAFNIIKKGSRNKDWMFFTVAGVLGCYTIPSFLYPFATLNVLIFIYNYKNIRQQFVANVIAGVLVLLLYSPIMIVDGISALTSNQFVQPIERISIVKGIFFFYRAMFADIAGVPFFVVSLLLIPLVLTVFQKDRWHLSLWAVLMLAPFVLLFLHAVNPFYRTFLYYNFVLMFLMVVPFKNYLEKVPKYGIIIFVVLVQLVSVYSFGSKIEVNEGFNTDVAVVAGDYFDTKNTICFPCIASANYEFEARVRGVEEQVSFLNNEAASADTINNYDYVIMEKGRDRTVDKIPFATSNEQNIYKNRK